MQVSNSAKPAILFGFLCVAQQKQQLHMQNPLVDFGNKIVW